MESRKAKREYRRYHTIRCAWCAEPHETVKANAVTCSAVCRNKLKRYRDATGLELEEPAGRMSVKEAVAMTIQFLLIAEQRRRMERARVVALEAARTVQQIASVARIHEEAGRRSTGGADPRPADETAPRSAAARPGPPRS